MTEHLQSKKRMVEIFQLKEKLAQLDYNKAQRAVFNIDVSCQNLSSLAEQMFDTATCREAYNLASRLEFGSRLIGLQQQQIRRKTAATASADNAARHLSVAKHKSDLVLDKFKRSKMISDNRAELKRPYLAKQNYLIKLHENQGCGA